MSPNPPDSARRMATLTPRGTTGPVSRAWAWLLLVLHPVIPVAWVVAAFVATTGLPGLGEGANAALEDIVAADSDAVAAQARSAAIFGAPLLSDAALVLREPEGLEPDELRAVARGARAAISGELPPELDGLRGAVPLVNVPFGGLRWPERNTTAVTYLAFEPALNLAARERIARAYATRYLQPAADSPVRLSGASPARIAQADAIEGALPLVTAASVLLVALVVGLHFRSIGAPLVTLAAAAVAYLVTVRVLGWAGQRFDVTVPQEVEPVLVVLLLGLVTDYAIFYLSGLREALRRGLGRHAAMREATAQTTRIVLTAGLIVAAGTAALTAGRLDFFRAFGPGLALTALVSLAVCATFVPAAMALLGRRLFGGSTAAPSPVAAPDGAPAAVARPSSRIPRRLRPRAAVMATALRLTREEAAAEGRSRWRVLGARILASRPVALPVVAATVAALGLAAAPAARIDLGVGFTGGLPAGDPVRAGLDAAGAGFAPGILSPTEVLLERDGVGGDRSGLVALQEAIERQPGVAAVIGPREEPSSLPIDATVAASGDAARFAVVLDAEPDSAEAIDTVRALRERLPALAGAAGIDTGARFAVGGETALSAETVQAVVDDLVRISLAALAANLVLLAVFMRALVAPLYLLASSVLAFAASLGIAVWVLEELGAGSTLTYFVPLATAVLLVSLGSDYNVFVAGRIWVEARRRRLREAVAVAAPRAAGAITVAGITLAATFALLALVPLRSFREFALLMVVGVLVDALVVRSILIPGLISLFGEASFWPGRRLRRARHGDFVGAVSETSGLDMAAAERVTEATLSALSRRLRRAEAQAIALQVPERLAPAMDGAHGESFGAAEFVERVARGAGVGEPEARDGAAAVIVTLDRVVDPATMAYVRAQLPEDFAELLAVREAAGATPAD